jgi:uncharacterized surface protein with fasciclin (FAS1) repeats
MSTAMVWRFAIVFLVFLPAATLLGPAAGAAHAEERPVFTFDRDTPEGRWAAVNDDVMGGRSTGGAQASEEGTLIFSGVLSLENRGGFSSIRSRGDMPSLEGYEGLAARVRGDGRSYQMNLRTALNIPAGSYQAEFATRADEWMEVRLPFGRFQATAYGRRVPGAPRLDPAGVRSVGFTIADKEAGPFRLEVDWIKAYGGEARRSGPGDIVAVAVADGRFTTLATAVTEAGLMETLKGEGPLTVFAPTDDAFARLPDGTVEELLKPENRDRLRGILLYHVVPGRVMLGRRSLDTAQGQAVVVGAEGAIRVNEARVVQADVVASNGVIHAIDSVLLPPQEEPGGAAGARRLIRLAIARGVPLFNAGNAEACAAIYEVAATSLTQSFPDALSESDRRTLSRALERAQAEENPRDRAWILRRALDRVHESLR